MTNLPDDLDRTLNIPRTRVADSDDNFFINKARELASTEYNRVTELAGIPESTQLFPTDMYVVWFAKVLKNWKALVSTDRVPGIYFEVTYDGEAQQAYVDYYEKKTNQAYKLRTVANIATAENNV